MPKLQGIDVSPFFTKEFYQKKYPIWNLSDENRLYGEVPQELSQEQQVSSSSKMDATQIAILVLQLVVLLATVILFRNYTKKENA